MQPTKFRKKPVVIEAMRWIGTAIEASPVIDWVLSQGGTARYHDEETAWGGDVVHSEEHIAINTLEGTVKASAGDWIIRGVAGEFYPCKPDIFGQTYETTSQ